MGRMFIRQTRTRNNSTGEGYFTFRLVRGERIGGKVRQITVLNLGRHFPVKQEDWPLPCSRIEQLVQPQETLLRIKCPAPLERAAQRYVGQLVARAPQVEDAARAAGIPTAAAAIARPPPDFQEVDIDSLQQTQPRSVGVEQVGLQVLAQLGLVEKLTALGVNAVMRAAILGNLIGRMAHPASELATWHWLQTHSALGELIDVDFEAMSHMRLYRAADLLMHHRTAIEEQLISRVQTLFSLEETPARQCLFCGVLEFRRADTGPFHGRARKRGGEGATRRRIQRALSDKNSTEGSRRQHGAMDISD